MRAQISDNYLSEVPTVDKHLACNAQQLEHSDDGAADEHSGQSCDTFLTKLSASLP